MSFDPDTATTPGLGPVTREMAQARARELAALAARPPADVTQADYEEAKRELTGESDRDRQDAVLDPPPAPVPDPLPDSAGH